MFDTHVHLTDDALFSRLPELFCEAKNLGVRRFLIPAYSAKVWERAVKIAETYEGVYFAVGIHPLFINEGDLPNEREKFIAHKKCLAVGEVGLDYFTEDCDRIVQRSWFEHEVAFAAAHEKPLLLHCRKAYDDLLALLRNQFLKKPVAFVLHSYSGSAEQLKAFLDLGAYVSFSGTLTRTNAKKVLEVAKKVPLDRVIIETDSPYIGTSSTRPPLVSPWQLPEVLAAFASAVNLDLSAAEKLTDENAARFFNL